MRRGEIRREKKNHIPLISTAFKLNLCVATKIDFRNWNDRFPAHSMWKIIPFRHQFAFNKTNFRLASNDWLSGVCSSTVLSAFHSHRSVTRMLECWRNSQLALGVTRGDGALNGALNGALKCGRWSAFFFPRNNILMIVPIAAVSFWWKPLFIDNRSDGAEKKAGNIIRRTGRWNANNYIAGKI